MHIFAAQMAARYGGTGDQQAAHVQYPDPAYERRQR